MARLTKGEYFEQNYPSDRDMTVRNLPGVGKKIGGEMHDRGLHLVADVEDIYNDLGKTKFIPFAAQNFGADRGQGMDIIRALKPFNT